MPVLLLVLLLFAGDGLANSADNPVSAPGGAVDIEAAAAFENGDWAESARLYATLTRRRRWDDEAHNRLGFSLRKLGDYERALQHYTRALELNPRHRGALEYLGEAYVEMGRLADARATLDRLQRVCRQTDAAEDWASRCEEWRELAEIVDAAGANTTGQ